MNQREIVCIIIRHAKHRHQVLEKVLRAGDFPVRLKFADNLGQLKDCLVQQPMILFFQDNGQAEQHNRLLGLLQRLAPDCILTSLVTDDWKGLSSSRTGDTDMCSIATRDPVQLRQQVDYLLSYARLKSEFRQCKHLLSIAELRSQWLVDYAREAVAYVAKGRHLHVNIAYLSLFGFNSEAEALTTGVLQLVQPDERAIFEPLSLEAEQRAAPSNKLLMTLRNRAGQSFRAELRFIPSVFRGRRCIQLHVHPLNRGPKSNPAADSADSELQSHDPWRQPSASVREKLSQSAPQKSAAPRLAAPMAAANRNTSLLRPHFRELLNLRGSAQQAMSLARPYLSGHGVGGRRQSYAQLLARLKAPQERFKLDLWSIRACQQFLSGRQSRPIRQQIWVSVGDWLFRDPAAVRKLLESLLKSRSVNNELIIGLDSASCLQFRRRAAKILPILRETGVLLGLEKIDAYNRELEALLRLTQAKLVTTHAGLLTGSASEAGIPDVLKQLLEQLNGYQIAVIVDGVNDINTLNLLCDTTAGYLHGPILDKLSR